MTLSSHDLNPPSRLELRHIGKTFRSRRGEEVAVDDVSLTITPGEFLCLVGPSGCGKSTLLNIVAGLERPDTGEVLVDGEPVSGPDGHRMVMFQEHALYPWLDVLGNVCFPLVRQRIGADRKEREELALDYLRLVGLEKYARAHIHELSGGMRQRVALARALAPDPGVLLMDEPFAALDAMTREQLYGDIQRLCAGRRKTVVFVTHNVREAVCLGDRVVLLSAHPGRVRSVFSIPLPRPRTLYMHALPEYAALVIATLKGADAPKSD